MTSNKYTRHSGTISPIVVALLFCGPASLAGEWPQFRGPNGDGVSTASNVPVEWSATDHVVWKREIPGAGWSSPVLSRGRNYLTTGVMQDVAVSLRALCVDQADGTIVWNVEVFQPDAAAAKQMHSKNSPASSTPVVDGDRLYVHFGHMGTAALDLDGKIVWRQTALSYRPTHGNGGSPVLADGALIFSCDAAQDPFVAALEAGSGDIRWKVDRKTSATKTFSFSTPTVVNIDGQQQVLSCGSGMLAAYSPRDGREIWRVRYGEGYSVVPRPVWAKGLVFISSGFDRPILMAVNPQGASGDVTDTHVVWSHEKGAPLTPSVLVAGDELYFVSDNGVASCVDARTGNVHWTKRLGGDFSASPVCAEGRIYFQNEDGTTYVVKASTDYELLATNEIGERALASPAIDQDAIFLRTESHLWRVGN
jgi:outer membrane protein assembly factor BamB